jgi:hypothetical protein
MESDKTQIKFLLSINDYMKEETITYNQLLDYLGKDHSRDVVWKFQRITSHQVPLSPSHPDYKGSNFNVRIEWENG